MNTENSNNDEIEIGKLFQLIGKGFANLFNAIGDFLNFLFKALIFMLLFLRKHFIKFAIAAIIGFLGGYFSEGTGRPFKSIMIVSANFNSVHQLYNNITYYNNLIEQNDSLSLAELFTISNHEAASLKSIEIAPIITENEKLSLLDEFVKTADTTTVKLIEPNVYLSSLTIFNYKNHAITAKSTQKDIFKKLETTIIDNVSQNDYFKENKEAFEKNNAFETKELLMQLVQIDSLRNLYKQVLLKEAEKKNTGTQIDLSSNTSKKENEIELFKIQQTINTRLSEINISKAEEGQIINKISGFGAVGQKLSFISRAPGLYALFLVGLTLVVILLIELNKYLKKQL
ncbi:MAG: hypothetical protein HQ471_07950 [Flavobacteriales bacterium]|nr:hypothetical protein [Flavobacteriales bacterium]